jgi:hypothetical protein
MLEDWSGMDREKTKEYIFKCQVYLFLVNFFSVIHPSAIHFALFW